jgi:hypothetical protein
MGAVTHGDASPGERAGTATEIARALQIPAGTVWRYASEGAIIAIGKRGHRPLYDLLKVAEVRHARRVTLGLVDA